ncbi:uncharacterized protein LOC123545649 [Mercenaria mercenaria]|uniref:uncharacterized protein LOC123545649 n=1 Tax=Mercenaria mercenaria TaxID=6596 RepID=UPI00234F899C|nr:uncharacterized protein LOC123545649 [Mercenaria mercenaria]
MGIISAKDTSNSNDSQTDYISQNGNLDRAQSMSAIHVPREKRNSKTSLTTIGMANTRTVRNDATELTAELASNKKTNPNKNQEKKEKKMCQKQEEQSKQMIELSAKLDSQRKLINELLKNGIEIAAKGKWENSADLTEPNHLANELQRIFKKEWRDTKRSLIANLHNDTKHAALPTSSLKEVDIIKWLSYILQECYTFCMTKANLPISQFFAAFSTNTKLEFDTVKCSNVERYYFLKMRKTVGMRSDVMEGICQEFWSKCVYEEKQRNSNADIIADKREQNKVNVPSTQGDSEKEGKISCTANTTNNIASLSKQEGGGNISDNDNGVTKPSSQKEEGKPSDIAKSITEPNKQKGSDKECKTLCTVVSDRDCCKEIGIGKDGKISETAYYDTDPGKQEGSSTKGNIPGTSESDNDRCKKEGSGKDDNISGTADFITGHCKQEESDKGGITYGTAESDNESSKGKGTDNKDEINYNADSITDRSTPQRHSVKEGKLSSDSIAKPNKQEGSGKEGRIANPINQKGCGKEGIISNTADIIRGNGEIVEELCKSDTGTDYNKIICSYIMHLKSNDKCLKQCQKYVTVCINACWKAVISDPPVHLQFNLTGKNFKDIDEKYGLKKYTLNMPYRDTSKKHNEIVLVVWPPCITYEYGGHEDNVLATENARVIVNNLDEC